MSAFDATRDVLARKMEQADDIGAIVSLIGGIETLVRDLRDAANTLHARAYEKLGGKTGEVGGVMMERTTDVSRKWDSDAVWTELIAAAPLAVHPDSGELTIDGVALAEVLRTVCHVDYWRIEKLKELGLDPDKYCEKKWGNKRVRPQRSRRGAVPDVASDTTKKRD